MSRTVNMACPAPPARMRHARHLAAQDRALGYRCHRGDMSSAEPHVPPARANSDTALAQHASMPLATVLRVSEGLRGVFGSPGYKPPMLPSVALEIHDLSCRPDIDTDKLVTVLEHDPMLAAHVLRVANSPIFRGRDAEASLRNAVLRLGLKNLGEVVFEIALHMRVFRSAEYSGMMEQLRRHSTACGNLCRLLASRVGQDHEDVSGMLVRQWKLPGEVAEVVSHHHGRAAVTTAPLLSAVVAVADRLSTKFGFSVDLGPGASDGSEEDVFLAACAKLNLDLGAMSDLEKEARQTLARVDEALKHKNAASEEETAAHAKQSRDGKPPDAHSAPLASAAKVASSARKPTPSLLARAWRAGGPPLWGRKRREGPP